jgi:Cytochrome P450
VQTLFLAMALYPEIQKKAQAEIDAVVGPNRLPDFHDRPSLPYINAVIKESLRWNLVTPGRPFVIIIVVPILTSSEAIPHMATIEDEYKGFYIPKGTVIIANAWLAQPLTNPIFYPEFLLGRYCTTVTFSITPRNSSLNDI